MLVLSSQKRGLTGVCVLFSLMFAMFVSANGQSLSDTGIGFASGYLSSDAGTLAISGGDVISAPLSGGGISFFPGVAATYTITPTSFVESSDGLPQQFALYQNYPNPFNPSTIIAFDLPEPGEVVISIYTTLGTRVDRMAIGQRPAGTHQVSFSGQALASGIYLYALQVDGRTWATRKMTLIK